MYTASKRIKLEIPGCSGLKFGKSASKPDQPGLSSSIRLEAVYIQTHTNKTTFIFVTVRAGCLLSGCLMRVCVGWLLLKDGGWLVVAAVRLLQGLHGGHMEKHHPVQVKGGKTPTVIPVVGSSRSALSSFFPSTSRRPSSSTSSTATDADNPPPGCAMHLVTSNLLHRLQLLPIKMGELWNNQPTGGVLS